MSVVVTGATGHLGRLVVTELLAAGVPARDVVAVGRRTETLADLTAQGVRVVAADYEDPDSLRTAFAGADTLMLVSSNAVGRRVGQHQNAIDAARDAGVRRIVYTSAPHADTSALVLAPEHKATEEALQASGLVVTVLRSHWYTENYLPTLEQARVTGEVVASVGEGRVASATRADLAAGAAVVLTTEGHDGAVYELGGDVAWTHHDLAAAIGEVLGTDVTYRAVSPEEHLAILTGAGLDEGTAQFVVALDGNIRDGALAEVTGDLSRLLGRPTTTLVDGLRAAAGAAVR
jgi:NAD(P)H dehydrogenase (quinone)